MLRRLKTWLRSTMSQSRLTHLSMLTIEKVKSAETDIKKIAGNLSTMDGRKVSLEDSLNYKSFKVIS